MNSRVGQLNIRCVIDEADTPIATAIRHKVESRFVIDVLNSLEKEVHARYGPEALLRIRRLDVHWSLDASQLNDSKYIEIVALELAEQIRRQLGARGGEQSLRPSREHSMVLFENDSHLCAIGLTEAAAGSDNSIWYLSNVPAPDQLWNKWCHNDAAAELKKTLDYLQRLNSVKTVIGRMRSELLLKALTVLPLRQWPKEAVLQVRARFPEYVLTDSNDYLISDNKVFQPQYPSDPHERVTGKPQPQRANNLNERLSYSQPNTGRHTEGQTAAQVKESSNIAVTRGPEDARGLQTDSAQPSALPTHVKHRSEITRGTPDDFPEIVAENSMLETESVLIATTGPIKTQYAGLFYTLNVVMELELPEILWCVGIREGDFIYHISGSILGEAGAIDAAPGVIGGVKGDAEPHLGVMEDWAREEVRERTLKSLHAMARRRDLALPDDLEQQINRIVGDLAPFQKSISHSETAATVAYCTAVLLFAMAGPLGRPPSRNTLYDIAHIPGYIDCDLVDIQVTLPMNAIDIDIRKQGFDKNPGYLPWLKRKVVLLFAQDQESDLTQSE